MKNSLITILLLTPLLAACDPIQVNVPPIQVSGCDVQPELCNKSDAEFEDFFDGLTDEEQTAYAEAQFGGPTHTGFVPLGTVAEVYDIYNG